MPFSQEQLISQDGAGHDDDLVTTRDDLGRGAFDEEHLVPDLALLPIAVFFDGRPVIGWVVEGQRNTAVRPASRRAHVIERGGQNGVQQFLGLQGPGVADFDAPGLGFRIDQSGELRQGFPLTAAWIDQAGLALGFEPGGNRLHHSRWGWVIQQFGLGFQACHCISSLNENSPGFVDQGFE